MGIEIWPLRICKDGVQEGGTNKCVYMRLRLVAFVNVEMVVLASSRDLESQTEELVVEMQRVQ